MKTRLIKLIAAGWFILTEIPGWPGAPKAARWRRALPIVFPCAAVLLLAGWRAAVIEPAIRAERADSQPLLSLDRDIAGLRLAYSEREAQGVATRTIELSGLLLDNPKEAEAVLGLLRQQAQSRRWEANFKPAAACEAPAKGGQVAFLPVRAVYTPSPVNAQPFPTLLALLEGISALKRHVDLTRLLIRADEQGRYSVQANLRLACRVHP